MRLKEEELEKVFTELLRLEIFSHHSGITIGRMPEDEDPIVT